MVNIEVSVNIKCGPDEVYALIRDMEKFPAYMRDVKALRITKVLPEAVITMWEVNVEDAPVTWKEKDSFDSANRRINFDIVEGDYKSYRGSWSVQPHQSGSRLALKADFDWGIPVLEKYVGAALEKRARRGLLGMIMAVKKKAESEHV